MIVGLYGETCSEIDMDDVVRRAIRDVEILARRRGNITFAELDRLLPSTVLTAEQVEQLLAGLSERDIHLVEDDDP